MTKYTSKKDRDWSIFEANGKVKNIKNEENTICNRLREAGRMLENKEFENKKFLMDLLDDAYDKGKRMKRAMNKYKKERIMTLKEKINLPNPWDRAKPNVPKNVHGWFTDPKKKTIERLLKENKVKIILEVGSWLGQSALFFADRCQYVICIDTWLGNDNFFREDRFRPMLPTAYETFLVNCWEKQDKIFPIRLESFVGLWYLAEQKIRVDAIYIDASHYYEDVKRDIKWALKLPGKPLLIGDDFIKKHANNIDGGITFPVQKAVKEIFGNKAQSEGTTWWVNGNDTK